MKIVFIWAIAIGLFVSCSNSEIYEKISGNWKCTSWKNESRGIDKCRDNVRFEFQMDREYYSQLAGEKDSGSYKIKNDMLYVTPKGKMEFAVKITKLNADTLQFLMSQVGEKEILTLVREE